MKRKLLLSIAMAVCFCVAQGQVVAVTRYEIDALKDHSKEIMERANHLAEEETMRTHMQYRVLRKDEERLRRYILHREIRKCCYDFIFPDSLTMADFNHKIKLQRNGSTILCFRPSKLENLREKKRLFLLFYIFLL